MIKPNISTFDRWSLVHFATGILGAKAFTMKQWLLLHTVHEILENTGRGKALWRRAGWERYDGDSLANVAGDTAASLVGFIMGKRQ